MDDQNVNSTERKKTCRKVNYEKGKEPKRGPICILYIDICIGRMITFDTCSRLVPRNCFRIDCSYEVNPVRQATVHDSSSGSGKKKSP